MPWRRPSVPQKFSADIRNVRRNSENTIAVLRSKIEKMQAAHKEELEAADAKMKTVKAENSKLMTR